MNPFSARNEDDEFRFARDPEMARLYAHSAEVEDRDWEDLYGKADVYILRRRKTSSDEPSEAA